MLYRAGGLTKQNGFDHFRVVHRATDADSRVVRRSSGYSPSPTTTSNLDYGITVRGRDNFYDPTGAWAIRGRSYASRWGY